MAVRTTAAASTHKTSPMPLVNREMSWLSFNERVLQEAADWRVPLIERLRFLGIFSANLDEFFQVRVASLRRLAKLKRRPYPEVIGDPAAVLRNIHQTVVRQQKQFEQLFEQLLRELATRDVHLLNEHELSETQADYVQKYFEEELLATLVPIILGSNGISLELKDRVIYLAVHMHRKGQPRNKRYALIELPTGQHSRFLKLPSPEGSLHMIMLDDVIRYNLPSIFRIFSYDSFSAHTIKLTHDAELDIPEHPEGSVATSMEESLRQRDHSATVRFIYDESIPGPLLSTLKRKLGITRLDSIIPGGRYHNFRDFRDFPGLDRPELEYPAPPSVLHPFIQHGASFLRTLQRQDVMLFQPYHSFDYFLDFLREAAINPEVTEIKISIYRVAWRSKVVNALINAIKNGKRVVAIVELQARLDEERNLKVANKLQKAGCVVVPGMTNLKVHTRICLVQSRDTRYSYVSTANFDETTASHYLDASLFTSDAEIGDEVNQLFKFLRRGYELGQYRHLLVGPIYMRTRLIGLIRRETELAREGKLAFITLKLNNLTDVRIIERLYEASQAGVTVNLIVRGSCSLVAGTPGYSDNIRLISIVDRYLEHMRVAVFGNDNQPLYYLSSSDLMVSNLERQVEVMCPVRDPVLQAQLQKLLHFQLQDRSRARYFNYHQQPDNRYVHEVEGVAPGEGDQRAQELLRTYLQSFHDRLVQS